MIDSGLGNHQICFHGSTIACRSFSTFSRYISPIFLKGVGDNCESDSVVTDPNYEIYERLQNSDLCDQASSFARSRNMNFWIFPVSVFGSGPNTIVLGALK